MIPSPKQCIPSVETQLNQIKIGQSKITQCPQAAHKSMGEKSNKGAINTPHQKVDYQVCMSSQNISMKRPSSRLDHRRLGPFPIYQQICMSTHNLTSPVSMKGEKMVFHVSVLHKHVQELIVKQRQPEPAHVMVGGRDKYKFQDILDCQQC